MIPNSNLAKQVWSAPSAEAKRKIISDSLGEEYILSLNVGFRNDFFSNNPNKIDTLISNIVLKAEKMGSIGSKFRK